MILDAWAGREHAGGVGIEILGPKEIEKMRLAGKAAAATLKHVGERLKAGMSTLDIDALVRAHTKELGGKPSQLGYHGFPATVCTSRNEVVCHGIPNAKEILKDGDIINVDVTTDLNGFHGDCSATFVIGEASEEAKKVARVARECRDAGIAAVKEGVRLGDIGAVIEAHAKKNGCSVVRDFGGHGIGRKMHMDPHVPHFGDPGKGVRLKAGMAITIEPMVNLGRSEIEVLDDDWTVVTVDRKLSAQFEHTVIVTRDGHEITTL